MAYSLSGPDAPSVIGEQEARQRDTAMTMAIQSLAMDRLRSSVRSLSRETNFESRPMENFAYAPLFIPKYRQWSNTQQKLVGTPPPTTTPTFMGGNRSVFSGASRSASTAISMLQGNYTGQPTQTVESILRGLETSRYGRETSPWANYIREYQAWQEQQRNLPV